MDTAGGSFDGRSFMTTEKPSMMINADAVRLLRVAARPI